MASLAEKDLKPLPERFPVPSDVRQALQRILGPRKKGFYEKFCFAAGRVFGVFTKNSKLSQKTLRNLKEAGIKVEPREWAAGLILSLTIPALFSVLVWLWIILSGGDFLGSLYLPIAGFLIGGILMMAFQSYPVSVAAQRRADAQAKAIGTVMLLSFSLYHRPDLRGATVQAADMSEGKLAEDLQKGLLELEERRRYDTVRHLLTVVANDWGEIDDSVRQAIFDLLRSTGAKEEAARLADVAKAPERVLEGAEEQLTNRLNRLILPTLAFLTFSSLAIISVVGLSPIFGVIGLNFVDLKFFAAIALGLIVAFLAFTQLMLGNRPATIQIQSLPEDDPRLPPPGKFTIFGRKIPLLIIPIIVFAAVAWPGVLYLIGENGGPLGFISFSFSTFWFVWAVAAAIGVYAYLYVSGRTKIREEERRKLVDWGNALNTIGSRMLDGKPMPQAMDEAANLMAGSPLAVELKEVSRRMGYYGMNLQEAMFERRSGSPYNPMIKSFLQIISRIRRDSEAAAGRACMMAAEFLRTLHRVERRFRERIDEAMGNLWLVAAVLIPVVCAMSVWVMDFMSGMKFSMAAQAATAGVTGIPFLIGVMSVMEIALLRLIMGITAVALSFIIARYIANIRAAGDQVELWSSVAKSALVSAAIFTVTSFLLTLITVGGG
ncbi:MAG: hypothetical protein ACP5PX_01145 [Candidatus Hadarchaeum sp.]|uniref:hypothetical protein n=1 Tax=Candidatus Hadarchaeum sp. TaxID=2883567 RepID=UPI003D0A5090